MQEINVNAERDKFVRSKMSQSQTGSRSSDRRFYRAVLVCLGLLSVFLLVGLGLGVHYHNLHPGSAADFSVLKNNLTQRLHASNNQLSDVSEERDQLKAKLSSIITERDRLNVNLKDMKRAEEAVNVYKMKDGAVQLFLTSSPVKRQRDCKNREADLVVIDSAEEQKFLSGLITADMWIGLTDSEDEGTWKWTDGSPLTLRYWEKQQPDNFSGDNELGEENCAHIRPGKKTEENWNDLPCDTSQHWICEKKSQQ
ncbi:hypothetical protein Q5P01_013927 [Channa striata]|uniref:C-type lectin domain-containing protein n=1 Tax=Channa striata TaxID=64152 RepID=A0AA88MNB4_CHASR|nr:hypothetical protein Q5P01_013927 [Channa striata]